MKTEVLNNPTVDQIKEVCERLSKTEDEKYYRAKFIIEFAQPTQIIKGGHWQTVNKMRVGTFDTAADIYCYTFGSHKGWAFNRIPYQNIKAISYPTYEEVTKKNDKDHLTNVVKALKLIHPNAWDDLKVRLMETPNNYKDYGNFLKIATPVVCNSIRSDEKHTYYKSVFDTWVIESIQKAFENKTDFGHGQHAKNCQVKVECSMGQDGIFRAWYTRTLNEPKKPSKYSSGGRDFCYLLLNPTTAWFAERD